MAMLPLETTDSKKAKLWSVSAIRLQICLLLCASLMCICLSRGSMSVAMVCITTPSNSSDTIFDNTTEVTVGDASAQCNKEYQVDWNAEQQARVHTAYYVGAAFGGLIVHILIQRFNCKTVISITLILQVIGSLLTPTEIIVLGNHWLLAFIRFAMGVGLGLIPPCANQILAQWFPTCEKSTAMAVYAIGNQIGIAISLLITAKLSQSRIFGGWPLAVWLYGFLSLLVFVVWIKRGNSRAIDSKVIQKEELYHITGLSESPTVEHANVTTPWKKVFTSLCLFACCINSFMHSFIIAALGTYLPKFNSETLKMDLTMNGLCAALPFFLQLVTKVSLALWADLLKQSGYGVTFVVRLFNGIGAFGSGISLCLLPLTIPFSPLISTLLICMAVGLLGSQVAGYMTTIITIAPEHTSAVSTILNLFSQASGIIAQYVVGIYTENNTISEWSVVFVSMGALMFLSGILFQLWAHGEAEPWSSEHLHGTNQGKTIEKKSHIDVEKKTNQVFA